MISFGTPGPSFTQTNRSEASCASTKSHDGVKSATFQVRPRAVRRAGSRKIAAPGGGSCSSARPTRTSTPFDAATALRACGWVRRIEPVRSAARRDCVEIKEQLTRERLCAATAAISGSASTATTRIAASRNAMASAPIPQPRSQTSVTPASTKRRARQRATARRVACSSPSRVNSISSARSNLAAALRRSTACPSAHAASSAPKLRLSRSPAPSDAGSASAIAAASASSLNPATAARGCPARRRGRPATRGGRGAPRGACAARSGWAPARPRAGAWCTPAAG